MSVRDFPIVSHVVESGADDRVFDFLLLVGPLVIALVTVFGRTLLTGTVVLVYIGVFLGHIVYQGMK